MRKNYRKTARIAPSFWTNRRNLCATIFVFPLTFGGVLKPFAKLLALDWIHQGKCTHTHTLVFYFVTFAVGARGAIISIMTLFGYLPFVFRYFCCYCHRKASAKCIFGRHTFYVQFDELVVVLFIYLFSDEVQSQRHMFLNKMLFR